jgi:hypothetical protein
LDEQVEKVHDDDDRVMIPRRNLSNQEVGSVIM